VPLQIVGAGLGRTGTHSLKVALEELLGGPCYHMVEVFQHPDHMALWIDGLRGRDVDWHALFAGYVATVDWPGSGVWEPIAAAFPDAPVLLSTRASADEWHRSASRTIFEGMATRGSDDTPRAAMNDAMREQFGVPSWRDEAACKAAYERHNDHVRAVVPPERLVEWQPSDGWGPLCAALGVPVPPHPFPVTNTTADFRAMLGLDP